MRTWWGLWCLISTACGAQTGQVSPGAYQLADYLPKIMGMRVGVYCNHSAEIYGTHLLDTLVSHDINIVRVFSPEHGIKGNAADGEIIEIQDHTYPFDLISLYGKAKKPTEEQLGDLDVLLIDIQEVGIRFYTYSTTMTYLMQVCADLNIPVLLLDRPNPNGSYVDGPVLSEEAKSIVGLHPIPIVHGLTLGEFASMINGEGWLGNGRKVELEIVRINNWEHQTPYSLPVRPSPNLPNDLAIALYPSLALFEGTIVSIGRGTETQFQVIGHPISSEKSYAFTPSPNLGSKYPKLDGELCFGESFVGQNPEQHRSFTLKHLMKYYQDMKGSTDEPFFKPYIKQLIGYPEFQEQIEMGMTEEEIRKTWQPGLSDYLEMRAKYLLYP